MNKTLKKQFSKERRIHRVRAKVQGNPERPRLTVRRSLKHIYAQIIDDAAGKTLVSASDKDVKASGKKPVEIATEVGKALAEKAAAQKIQAVVFDRRDKKYHGRVKALAEGAREGGLTF